MADKKNEHKMLFDLRGGRIIGLTRLALRLGSPLGVAAGGGVGLRGGWLAVVGSGRRALRGGSALGNVVTGEDNQVRAHPVGQVGAAAQVLLGDQHPAVQIAQLADGETFQAGG